MQHKFLPRILVALGILLVATGLIFMATARAQNSAGGAQVLRGEGSI